MEDFLFGLTNYVWVVNYRVNALVMKDIIDRKDFRFMLGYTQYYSILETFKKDHEGENLTLLERMFFDTEKFELLQKDCILSVCNNLNVPNHRLSLNSLKEEKSFVISPFCDKDRNRFLANPNWIKSQVPIFVDNPLKNLKAKLKLVGKIKTLRFKMNTETGILKIDFNLYPDSKYDQEIIFGQKAGKEDQLLEYMEYIKSEHKIYNSSELNVVERLVSHAA